MTWIKRSTTRIFPTRITWLVENKPKKGWVPTIHKELIIKDCKYWFIKTNSQGESVDFQNILCWIFVENQNIQNILCEIFWKSEYSKNLGYSKYSTGLLWIFWFSTNIQQQYILNICHFPMCFYLRCSHIHIIFMQSWSTY